MGKSKVGGWFLIGLVLPVCGMAIMMMVANTRGSALESLPVVLTFAAVGWAIPFLLRRWLSSSYYDPRHAHRLFTPYYDER